ncbi:AraC family transcriptional regulator [Kibdelosporangium aridum]|uniref:AraC-type DNA-binding protein n=1 Tax=Kibdelosporangium aridum TaxID=2030 RepID=A0A1Y5Y406_KIBAR|nr:AraC family transcriptional regulator [Kibdelosporangium aridum]SMD24488.1 AraC-type DNA-binding protein [Kibdelosporangium aridum]
MPVADYPAGARLPTRVIEDFEFVWMLRGRATFRSTNRDIVLTPDVLLLVPPGVEHSFDWDTKRPSRHGYVHFDRPDLDKRVRIQPMRDPLRGLCGYLLSEERAIDQTIDFMLTVIHFGSPEPDRRIPGPVRLAIEYLREHWATMPLRRISVAELAAAAHVSRGYLNRLFQRTFDLSAATALEHIRCARAEILLVRTDLTAEAIAKQCGFADVSHFSHRFTLVHGVSPSVYRAHPVSSVLDHPGLRGLNRLIVEAV